MMMRTGARIWSVLASTSVRVASPSIFLTVESTRAETAGYAPGPRENTLEGRGLVVAVSGRAVLGGRTAPCLRGARCSPKNAGSPDVNAWKRGLAEIGRELGGVKKNGVNAPLLTIAPNLCRLGLWLDPFA